jgi:gamma-glutamyltranspeptidase/glutathione hydrolase
VTAAAARILAEGGNAFDAAVAAGFASAVAEPALTSVGGGGFLLAHPMDGPAVLFDFFVDTPGRGRASGDLNPHLVPVTVRFPGSEQVFHVGLGSVAPPGNLRGLLTVHTRLGRVPLADVLAPAIELARDGVELNPQQAYFLDLLRPIKTLFAAGRQLYEPHGHFLSEGDRFRNPELAAFLETLPRDGDREFYEGEIARAIAQDMRDGDGLLTEADLAAYRVIEREPLRVRYRDHELLTNPPPSFGGSLVALGLRLLEAEPVSALRFGEARHLALLVAVMQEMERLRAEGAGDPIARSDAGWRESAERVRQSSGGTTHLSVCDAAGNVASMTTSNGEGSGYFAPGTGIMLNNMMGEDDLHPDGFHSSPPGLRVASMMSPSILLAENKVRLVLGSGGSKRIRTALLQALSNVVDFDMAVREAVEAPRLHWDGECVQVEPGFDAAAVAELAARQPTNTWTVRDVYFGGVHAVAPAGEGAGDPRRGGCASVLS